jgi:hypothetical protein
MKESYSEGLAIHTGSESCGGTRKGGAEALTGVRAGQVLSRESHLLRGAEAVRRSRRQQCMSRYRERQAHPARSKTLRTHGNTSRENREIGCVPRVAGRFGKSKDERRR